MRIVLALAAVLAFAAAPSAQSLQDAAPAVDIVVSEAPAVVATAAPAPTLEAGVDLSAHVAPSTVDIADVDVQDARRGGMDVAYVGSMVAATVALAAFAYLFI